jgi:hypothetical protein
MRIFGAQRTAGSGSLSFPAPRQTIWRISLLLAVLYLAPILILQLASLAKSPEFGPASLVEETAYTYISAGNFLRYGFLNSGLLQDFSSSPYPEDHPFVYVHMPAGPDVLTAVLLGATGHNYALTRFIFAIIFVAGLYVFARFVELLLRERGLAGGGLAILFVGAWILAQGSDRLIYSPFPLLAFGPVLLLARSHASTKRIWIACATLMAFVASIYLEYSLLSGVLISWLLLYELKLLPGGRRYAVALVLPALAGILAHLIQNLVFLGPHVFLTELANVIGNRTTGFPTQETLKAWYQEIGVVHHGSKPVRLSVVLSQIRDNFQFFETRLLVVIALVTVICASTRVFRPGGILLTRSDETKFIGRLFTWVVAVVIAPIALFPAFAQEVNLRGSGANQFFLAVAALAVCAQAFVVVRRWSPVAFEIRENGLMVKKAEVIEQKGAYAILAARLVTFGMITVLLLHLSFALIRERAGELRSLAKTYREVQLAALTELRNLRGSLFMTNINLPLVSYYMEYPGFGVCEPSSVSEDGDIDVRKCKVSFVRREAYWSKQPPKYFIYFREGRFFPGFGDCLPEGLIGDHSRAEASCVKAFEAKLRRNFSVVLENRLFTTFSIGSARERAVAR